MSITEHFPVNWDLDTLYPFPESDTFRELLSQVQTDLRQLAADSEALAVPESSVASAAMWGDFLERLSDIQMRLEDMHSFTGCHAAADAANQELQRLEGVLAALEPLRTQVLTNVELAIRETDDALLRNWRARDDRLTRDAFFIEEARLNGAFRLPKAEELLAAELDVDGRQAWSRLYDRLSGQLRIEIMERGEIVRKSPGQINFDSPERSVRQNNFFAAQRAWNTLADSCAEALNHIAGSRLTRYRRLNVHDHLDRPLRMNRMQRETLDSMWGTISECKPVLKRYLDAKARWLGLKQLAWYDVQAPVSAAAASLSADDLSYDDACRIVVESLQSFSPEFGEFAKRALTQGWVEVEDRPGKRQGGFCTGFPKKHQSRIFMTYRNTPDSMSTLAHELGHAYHSYVLRDQPPLLQEYPMNLAETASTFAEAILAERQLAQADTDDLRRSLLDQSLSDAVAFLMNIHARFLFEDRFHQERHATEVSAERLSQLMRDAQQEAYLNSLDPQGWYPEFWISKLHFYIASWPFYNFPYTFGYLLSLGLFELRDHVPDFPTRFRNLLIASGSRQAEETVAESFGFDLRQPDFWRTGLEVVERRVNQFVNLT